LRAPHDVKGKIERCRIKIAQKKECEEEKPPSGPIKKKKKSRGGSESGKKGEFREEGAEKRTL